MNYFYDEISRRRALSIQRFKALEDQLSEANTVISDFACVYASGSFGRREAAEHSDLDLFIIGDAQDVNEKKTKPKLGKLDEVLVKADLIRSARRLNFPDFDKQGEFIKQHLIQDLVDTLGTPADDHSNTFTARLLLLLESKPLCGQEFYYKAIHRVIDAYWRDYEGREDSFVPAFLINDILRLWRTFCVNYESASSSAQKRNAAERRIKNYKLKHSRILTCFSSIIYFQAIFQSRNTVSKCDVHEMIKLTPLERLEEIGRESDNDQLKKNICKCLKTYNNFLLVTRQAPDELRKQFSDEKKVKELFDSANDFGDSIAETISLFPEGSHIKRIVSV